mmetsp:Transcript_8462/g.13842  ORF Transcript_8462/g.13842 Transcript_8462/m.13842 type:complete len:124 (-) Transcript_8462:574-945(-)
MSHWVNKVSAEHILYNFEYEDEKDEVHRPALSLDGPRIFLDYMCGLDMSFLECASCNRSTKIAPYTPTDPVQIKTYLDFYSGLFGHDFSTYTFDSSHIKLATRKYNSRKDGTGWRNENISSLQ